MADAIAPLLIVIALLGIILGILVWRYVCLHDRLRKTKEAVRHARMSLAHVGELEATIRELRDRVARYEAERDEFSTAVREGAE